MKRGYSRDFTPRSEAYGRYLLDKIPAELWTEAKRASRRQAISMRRILLGSLEEFVACDYVERKHDREHRQRQREGG